MIYGYIRVSTDKQTVENQRFEIIRFCSKNNLTIDDWIEETMSGTKEALARKKAEGVKLGRPKETELKYYKLRGHKDEIRLLLDQRVPKTHIADIFDVTPATLYRYMKIVGIPLEKDVFYHSYA